MNRESKGIHIINGQYIASAVRPDQYPEGDFTEIAFIGRSNVGKSSLINSLAGRHGLARTSGQPGKTQTINYFKLTVKVNEEERKDFYLVDLPGYGYARTGQANRRQWSKFVEEYFLKSPRLKLICLLIDVRHPPMSSDITMFRWLADHNLPFQVIGTKADKLSKMALNKNVNIIEKSLGITSKSMIPYSASSGVGKTELLDVIGSILLK